MSIFEIGMLLCFGFAWPMSIYKSVKSKSIEGKSLVFMYVVVLGYTFGIIHKFMYNQDFVIALYMLNAVMVSVDIGLYYRNKKLSLSVKENSDG
ncbi:hypothetical protein RJI07_08180 [Mycoplasmatota bacterium WC30]